MKKVAIMCRVSSDDQAKGYSLDAQYEALTKYCERNEYEIVYSFREDHSAKTFNIRISQLHIFFVLFL